MLLDHRSETNAVFTTRLAQNDDYTLALVAGTLCPAWRREVPLLLSRHLRSASRHYDDVPELELRDTSNSPVADADLIAASDDDVIVAEAKSNKALGANAKETKRAAAKRVRLADVLRADQIILATTEPEWSDSSITEIGSAVTGHPWPTGRAPAIRLITGLGSEQIQDLRFDPASGTTARWS